VKLRVGLLTLVSALILVSASAAQSFSDPVGDTEGPDIDSVAITHAGATLNIDIHIANRATLGAEEAIQVEIDLDSNANTGDDGIDLHALYVEGEPTEVLLWQNDDYIETTRATINWTPNTAHVHVPLALVTRAVKVEVAALGIAEDEDTDDPVAPADDPVDVAPDDGAFEYTVATEARRLIKSTATFAPAQPRAGKAFRLSGVALEFNDVGTVKATTTCSAKLAGKKFGKGCSWKLPKTAKKKALVITVSAAYGGDKYSLTRKFVVRA
jgi:hypothetical protein